VPTVALSAYATESAVDATIDAHFGGDSTGMFDAATVLRGSGIDPTGATDSSTAMQAKIDAGTVVYAPPGTYLCSGLTLASGQSLIGGPGVTFQAPPASTGPVLTISGATSVLVDGITFNGNVSVNAYSLTAPDGTQDGLYIAGASQWVTVRNCMATNFGQAGIHLYHLGNTTTGAPFNGITNKVADCQVDNCYYGIWLDTRAEYVSVNNCSVTQCRVGGQVQGGNTILTGSHFNDNNTGLLVASDTNSGHGSATGCTFNHNFENAAQVDEPANGFAFTGCQFFFAVLLFNACAGVTMTGCEFGSLTIRATGGGRNSISDSSLTVGTCTVTHDYLGVTSDLLLTNVFDAAGSLALSNAASVPATDVQLFTASGTWTKPTTGVPKAVLVQIWAGGGGGGSGARRASGTLATGGAGGPGSGVSERWLDPSLLGTTEPVTVGVGGTGGAAVTTDDTNGNPGGAAGLSRFGATSPTYGAVALLGTPQAGGGTSTWAAVGGTGGVGSSGNGANGGNSSATGGTGSGGGTGAVPAPGTAPGAGAGGGLAVTTPVATAGGKGGSPSLAVDFGGLAGSAGGSAAGNGLAQPGGFAAPGGAGGGGGSSTTGAGVAGGNGANYGAGGGGGGASLNGNASGKGGDGAPGAVVVTTYF